MQAGQDISGDILTQFHAARVQWGAIVFPMARNLFAVLALIEFAVAGVMLLLERHSLQEWAAFVFRQALVICAFYALLIFGMDWMHAIVSSLELIGQQAAQSGALSPGDVFTRGLNIAGALMASANAYAYLTNPAAIIQNVVAAVLIVIGFALVSTAYLVAMVEAYIGLSAGMIFLGFGGARWTRAYVERIMAMAVATGVKIMVLYMVIGIGMFLSDGWLIEASSLGTSTAPGTSAMRVMGAAFMFALLAWQVPKFFAGLMGGSPNLTGGDALSVGMAGGYMMYRAASGAVTSVTSAVTGTGSNGNGSYAGTGRSSGGSGAAGAGASTPTTVPAPSPAPATAGAYPSANGSQARNHAAVKPKPNGGKP